MRSIRKADHFTRVVLYQDPRHLEAVDDQPIGKHEDQITSRGVPCEDELGVGDF